MMNLKFCGCRMCKYGRNKGWGKFIIRKTKQHSRRLEKQILRTKNIELIEEIPVSISVPYTD